MNTATKRVATAAAVAALGAITPVAAVAASTASAKTAAAVADVLIAFGGKAARVAPAAKSTEGTDAADAAADTLPDGAFKADGYLVRFTTENDPDITALKDYFTKATYYGEAEKVPVFFHHGLPLVVKMPDGSTKTIGPGRTKIGTGALKSDDTGIFIDAIVSEAGEYQEAIQQLLDAGALGWSSGVPNHVVVREPVMNPDGSLKAHEIKQWLIAEGSLTHTPAEPRNLASPVQPAVGSIKSLLEDYGTYSYDYRNGYRDDWDAGQEIVESATDVVLWRAERAVRNIVGDDQMTPQQQEEAVAGVFDEAKQIVVTVVRTMGGISTTLIAAADATADDALMTSAKAAFLKYVPAGLTPSTAPDEGVAGLSLVEQGERLAGLAEAYTKRATAMNASRVRGGLAPLPATHAEIATKAVEALVGLKTLLTGATGAGAKSGAAEPAVEPAVEPVAVQPSVTPAATEPPAAATTAAPPADVAAATTDEDGTAATKSVPSVGEMQARAKLLGVDLT